MFRWNAPDSPFHYKDNVLITGGFYSGQKGVVLDYEYSAWFRTYQYRVMVVDGVKVVVAARDLESWSKV